MTAIRIPIPLESLLSTLPAHSYLIICHALPTILSALAHTLPATSPLLTPTLSALSTAHSAHVSLAFCDSVPALRAHLGALPHSLAPQRSREAAKGRTTTTVILADVAALHAHTPSHAAQGLARTLAAAVDAAISLHASLRVVALAGRIGRFSAGDDGPAIDIDVAPGDAGTRRFESGAGSVVEDDERTGVEEDPWPAELLPILEGSGRPGGRAWVGRRVSVETVIGRWCTWEDG
jgi:hypothetical protein